MDRLLETGPLVAFFDRSERFHHWAREKWARAPLPLLACEAIVADSRFHAQRGQEAGSSNSTEPTSIGQNELQPLAGLFIVLAR